MANQRILRGTAAVLSVTLLDQNGARRAAVGAVTVGVSRANGTSVTVGATSQGDSLGDYECTLTAANNLLLDELTCTWSDDGVVAKTTTVDVVGDYYFSVQEARESDPTLGGQAAYTDAQIIRVRQEVEEECERITNRAFVPRYRRETIDGTGLSTLLLAETDLRTIRAVTNYGTALTSLELAALILHPSGSIYWPYNTWYRDTGSVVIDYEYGWDSPPADLKRAALTRLRHRLNMAKSGIPDRAVSFTQEGGGTFSVATPGMRGAHTGIPDVDEVYDAYALRVPVVA